MMPRCRGRERGPQVKIVETCAASTLDGREAGNSLGTGAGAEAEEVLDLGGSDEDGDAVGEADDDHAGDEPDGGAEAGEVP